MTDLRKLDAELKDRVRATEFQGAAVLSSHWFLGKPELQNATVCTLRNQRILMNAVRALLKAKELAG